MDWPEIKPVAPLLDFAYYQLNTKPKKYLHYINLLTPNVTYSGRTVPLTSEVAFYIFFQQI